jgi:hypothetical protein
MKFWIRKAAENRENPRSCGNTLIVLAAGTPGAEFWAKAEAELSRRSKNTLYRLYPSVKGKILENAVKLMIRANTENP